MAVVCITNDRIPGIRACVVRDEHAASCDGDCGGCLPRPAKVGLLCWSCWQKLVFELARWDKFEGMLAGVDRAVRHDSGGVRSSVDGYVPIPAVRLALDECWSFLRGAPESAEAWVSTMEGARAAVQFARAAASAHRSHPVEEAPRKLRRVRCPDCGQLSFVRTPPEAAGLPVIVRCENDECGKTIREGDTTTVVAGDVRVPVEKLAVIAGIERRRDA